VGPNTWVRNMLDTQLAAHALARRSMARVKEKSVERYNAKHKDIEFTVEQKVWLYWPPRAKPGQSKKFLMRWVGPFTIERKGGRNNYEIRDETGERRKLVQYVHVARLKPWEEQPREEKDVQLPETDQFDWRKEAGLKLRSLEVSTRSEIPEGPGELEEKQIGEPDKPFVWKDTADLPLPADENPATAWADQRVMPDEEITDEQQEYEVERIVAERKTPDGETQYYVKWKGYSGKHNRWINESDLSASTLLREYYQRVAEAVVRKEKAVKHRLGMFNTLLEELEKIRQSWKVEKHPPLPKMRQRLLQLMGVDSPYLDVWELKRNLQKEIRSINSYEDAQQFLAQAIDNSTVTFAEELERIREKEELDVRV